MRTELIEGMQKDTPLEAFARKVASAYWRKCKVKTGGFADPWPLNVDVKCLAIFKHFIDAAKFLREVDGDPKDLVDAQFDGLSQYGRGIPFPSQLATSNGRIRYMEYMTSKRKAEANTLPPDLDFEERKAKKYAQRMGVSLKQAIKAMPREYSREFLEAHGMFAEIEKLRE